MTNILEELEDYLEIRVGELHDGVFSLERTSCLGCCNMSPAIRIGEKVYGSLTKDDIPRIISEYRRKYHEEYNLDLITRNCGKIDRIPLIHISKLVDMILYGIFLPKIVKILSMK